MRRLSEMSLQPQGQGPGHSAALIIIIMRLYGSCDVPGRMSLLVTVAVQLLLVLVSVPRIYAAYGPLFSVFTSKAELRWLKIVMGIAVQMRKSKLEIKCIAACSIHR